MPAGETITRTVTATITNQSQVQDELDQLGIAASKLWNIGRWTISRVWDAVGEIPDADDLCAYLKHKERYADLNAQSSQRVLQELGEAFHSWYAQDDPDANPPGYRKHGDAHPRSTVTFKADGFKHDSTFNRIRLSKGRNLKDGKHDFILCEYEPQPDVDLSEVESIQQVRAVWAGDEWELHIVYRTQIDAPEQPGERIAGIDLGIANTAAVSFGGQTLLYPGGALKEDAHYFRHEEYETEGENGPSAHAEWARRKKARRQHHFLHAISRDIVEQCVKRDVGTIAVGHPKHIRDDEEWGRHGNKRLHDWPFEILINHIEYKTEERGIEVDRVKEGELKTSKTCCACGAEADSHRIERGLYVCEACGLTANADVNAAENMRLTVPPSLSPGNRGWDRNNGCLAQPAVRLFDTATGAVAGREQVIDCKP